MTNEYNWAEMFNSLPSEELDKLAILRIIETGNGIVQFMFRDKEPDAYDSHDTRRCMKFSMNSIKHQRIELNDEETITFGPETAEVMTIVRDFYIRGMKRNDDAAYAEFLVASLACLKACGVERLKAARDKLFNLCYRMPPSVYDHGLNYCLGFLASSSYNKDTA